jgi:hypothetical protein
MSILPFCVAAFAAADGATITVRANVVRNTITPLMTGACIEDVNHELYGGLYAQMIFGESFEEPPASAPLPGWSYCEGSWAAKDGLYSVMPLAGGKAVWDGALLGDGTAECDVMLAGDGDNAGLILRVNDPRRGADAFAGYEISLSSKGGYLRLGKHENNWTHLRDAPLKLEAGRWHHLRVELAGGRIRIFAGNVAEPQIDFTDPSPLKPGRLGLRTWNAQASFRDLRASSGGKSWTTSFAAKQNAPWQGELSGMWDPIVTGDADARFVWDAVTPLNTDRCQMIEIKSAKNGTAGVTNRGLNRWGLCVREGRTYEGRVHLRGSYKGSVTCALQSVDGTRTFASQQISGIGSEWRQFPVRLRSSGTDTNARFAIWIDRPGAIWVDQVYLAPTGDELFAELPVRADIAQAILDEGLTVLRLGGSMINATGYLWKQMIGDPDKRRQYQGTWYPQSSRGFGIEEFVRFCEKARIVPVVAINIFEDPQDAADLIDYLNAPSTTRWGSLRASNGHPEPYRVRYIEIGNEEANNPLYLERFLLLYKAMWPRDPTVEFIIGCWWEPNNPNTKDIVQQLNGKAALWDLHVGGDGLRDADGAEAMIVRMRALLQEWTPGTTLKTCILEENGGLHNVQRALGHAHMRNTAERHGDFVLIECPANCLQPNGHNDNGWDQGQIFFNGHQVWGMPPFYAQQMAARHYQPTRLDSEVTCPDNDLDVTATRSAAGDSIVLKVVNLSAKPRVTSVKIDGIAAVARRAKTVTLTGDLRAINTSDEPRRIAPVEAAIDNASTQFDYTFPSYSYTIIELRDIK